MTISEKQAKFWVMLSKLVAFCEVRGTPIVVVSWKRTIEEQRLLVMRKASKTLKSAHLDGLAADVVFLEDLKDDGKVNYPVTKYLPLGLYWESIGGLWGGRFGDDPLTERIEGWDSGHFEFRQ